MHRTLPLVVLLAVIGNVVCQSPTQEANIQPFTQIASPMPVYGHAAAISTAYNQFVVIGGTPTQPKEQSNTSWASTSQIAQLDFVGTLASWKVNTNPDLPSTVNIIALTVDKSIYLLFGMTSWSNSSYNEKYAIATYDAVTGSLTSLTTNPPVGTPDAPDFRGAHSAAYDPQSNQIFVFGGVEKNGAIVRDLWILSLPQLTWRKIPESSFTHPAALGTWSVATSDFFITCFGTQGAKFPPVDTCSLFSIKENKWVESTMAGAKPPARSASRLIIHNNNLYVYGGGNYLTGEVFSDVWSTDLSKLPTFKWTSSNIEGPNHPGKRMDHSINLVGNVLLIFGGRNGSEGSDPVDSVIYALDVEKKKWLDNWLGLPIPASPEKGNMQEEKGPSTIVIVVIVIVVVLALIIGILSFILIRRRQKRNLSKGKGAVREEVIQMEDVIDGISIPKRTASNLTDELAPPAYSETYKIVAKTNYSPREKDELEMGPDDEILVLDSFGDGWARGRNMRTGEMGVFPVCLTEVKGESFDSGRGSVEGNQFDQGYEPVPGEDRDDNGNAQPIYPVDVKDVKVIPMY